MKTKFSILNFHSIFQILNSRFFHSRSARKAFTLLELLIYSGILVVSAGLIGGIVYTISKANLRTQVNDALSNQLILFEEIFRQKIQIAKGINSISGYDLSLEMKEDSKNPTVFTLSNDVAYITEGDGGQPVALNDSNKVKVTDLEFTSTGPEGTLVSNTYHYAWNYQIGWIDFTHPGCNVQVPTGEGDLKGFAYVLSDSHWISLNCISTNSCYDAVNNPTGIDYKVFSDVDGNLTGWAWSENFGWISFNCETDNTCSLIDDDYKVTIDQDNGEFDGYAYSENIGWTSFNCKTGGVDPIDICDDSDYKVQDLRINTSAIKVDITLEYNSEKHVTSTNSFVFNLITPTK